MAAKLKAAGTGRWLQTGGDAADGIRISGTGAQLLAWLPGRSGHPGGTCLAELCLLPSIATICLT